MTESEAAQRFVERLLHDAHIKMQRQAMAPDAVAMPCSEVRGIRRERSKRERDAVWNPAWMTGLRPNFWKAYFETLVHLSK
jgi:hypothetical protein